ncbi:MAG: type I-E CRISPR-associated protein Cas6/Cse3/CasE [Mesorhizobium sp.]
MINLWFTRATLKRQSADVAPLLGTLLTDDDGGRQLDTTHRLLWTLLPDEFQRAGKPDRDGQDKAAFLWRRAPDKEGEPVWYVLGPEPREECAFFHVESKPWQPALAPGDRLSFDLLVNATVDRMIEPGKGRNGRKRVDVVMDAMVARERGGVADDRAVLRREAGAEAMRGWWEKQAGRNGFRALATELADYRTVPLSGKRLGARKGPQLGISRLTGIAEVSDPAAFLNRVAIGFGRAKAFGCGLMLLKRAS